MTAESNPGPGEFGYDPIDHALSFVLEIPRDEDVPVRLYDANGAGGSEAVGRPSEPIAEVAQSHWNLVDSGLRIHFNTRIRAAEGLPAAWRFGANRLSANFGQELAVLLWGLEPAETGDAARVYANWKRLLPEERRWLYGRGMAVGSRKDTGTGWRRAIHIALLEESSPAGAFASAAATLPPNQQPPARRKRNELERAGQLRLL